MRATLAWAALRRHPMRTLLAIFGLAIAAALLIDMVMLATGMRASFRSLLTSQGYQLRVTPKGTLPFDTEASVGGAAALVASLRTHPDVDRVSPSLGTTVQVARGERASSAFALGTTAAVQGEYLLQGGREATADTVMREVVVNAALLERLGAQLGDTLDVGTERSAQLRQAGRRAPVVVVGEVRFLYVPPGLPAMATSLPALQQFLGEAGRDRISLAMASVRTDGGDAETQLARIEAVRQWIEAEHARVTAISTETAIVQVEERLAYFRQLAFILGALSLVIGVLLVTTLVSLSVNERLGELAVLRAIGVPQAGVLQQIMLEGLMLGLAGITLGLGLGLVTARWLNTILRDFPGLPADLDFFVWSPEAAWKALGMLLIASTVAGAIPAWRAARVRVAQALREEAVA
jgi:ABC-type lipoprotein release transport system permease subunit